jgi:2-C-methyl-D-erythritol 4-phosphate cytidylyltransferase
MSDALHFSVLILTAPPPGLGADGGNGAGVKIDGREALLRSVELFLNRDNVKQVQLVVAPDELEEAKRKYGAHLGLFGVKLVSGGPKWMDQTIAAGKNLSADATHVILHDAARPIVPYSDIDALMDEVEKHPAVVLTAPVRTTLVELDEGDNPMAFHMPRAFAQLLTPQAFTKAKFLEMTATGRELHPSALTLLKGSPLNIRLGGAGESAMAKAMLGMLPKPKMKAPSGPFEEAQW